MSGKIIHLIGWDKKFTPALIDFTNQNFSYQDHSFIIYGEKIENEIKYYKNVYYCSSIIKQTFFIKNEFRSANKIILHGLFNTHLLYILALSNRYLNKCYWAIWGGDLYIHTAKEKNWRWYKNEKIRRFVVSKIGHFITHIKGDFELAKRWYGAKGVWHECFMYPSNLFHDQPNSSSSSEGTVILLGNSADPSNHHIEILEKLRPCAQTNVTIYCPLSYGDQSYAKIVSEHGASIYGPNFIPLQGFLPLAEYIRILSKVDVAIFNHKRQQGMGNATTLLGMGKTVYMREGLTSYKMFTQLGVQIYSIEKMDVNFLKKDNSLENIKKIKNYFSYNRLLSQWLDIYE